MTIFKNSVRTVAIAAVLALSISVAYAHVTVQPTTSTPGSVESYTLKVPTEKLVPTTRIEIEIPAALDVKSFESKSDWKIEEKKDKSGKITEVILIGTIPSGESASFKFTAANPIEESKVILKVSQIYQDGSKSEWTGDAGSRSPAPAVQIKKAVSGAEK